MGKKSSFNGKKIEFWAFWQNRVSLETHKKSLTTEKQGHRQMFHARRGGPRTPSTTADANLDCAFVENALFTQILDFEKSTN